jgi:TatA/E family protein of Tat protein translocase
VFEDYMGLSFAQIALVVLVALLVIGPKKLPEVAKSLGKGYAEFKRTFGDLKKSVDLTSESSSKKNTEATSATYKSRWEEQTASVEKPEQPFETLVATEQMEQPTTPEPVARAKRVDLVKEDKEDSDGTSG